MTQPIEPTAAIDALNAAFKADPGAISALFINRVPCNEALADHPTIIVESVATVPDAWTLSATGLVNGVLVALGYTPIATKWSEPDDRGVHRMLGFCAYKPPSDVQVD